MVIRKALLSELESREHLKYLGNAYCVMTNHIGDQDTSKPQNHKLITVPAYSLKLTVFAEVTGLNPVEALNFFFRLFNNCINWWVHGEERAIACFSPPCKIIFI